MDYFVFSDIHGHGVLFDKIVSWLNGRSEPWKCIFLGDACDRMNDGYRIMETILNDDRFIYLKGNHEDLFVRAAKALRDYWERDNLTYEVIAANPYDSIMNYAYDMDVGCHLSNGGISTLMSWVTKGKTGLDIINKLDRLPTHMELPHEIWGKLDLSHAGHPNNDLSESALIWDRSHFNEKFEGGRMIHGHTPVRSLMRYVIISPASTCTPAFYADGTKIDIDTACFSTECITLLNLTSFEQYRFQNLIEEK